MEVEAEETKTLGDFHWESQGWTGLETSRSEGTVKDVNGESPKDALKKKKNRLTANFLFSVHKCRYLGKRLTLEYRKVKRHARE